MVRDILNETNVKLRAEIVVKFLHIARHLQELNNIHSLVAMVLAVKSLPIDRLTHTWKVREYRKYIQYMYMSVLRWLFLVGTEKGEAIFRENGRICVRTE